MGGQLFFLKSSCVMKCPPISKTIVFADEAKLAAQVCCALAEPGVYLPVCDGPRIQRPDAPAEVSRRHNAAARARSKSAYMVGLSDQSFSVLKASLQGHRPVPCHRISGFADVRTIPRSARKRDERPLVWGRDRIGIALLTALRSGRELIFEDKQSPSEHVPCKGKHLMMKRFLCIKSSA